MNGLLHTDGGARGNPGPAAVGVVIDFPDGEREGIRIGETIGDATNNVAEYTAVIRGLTEARRVGITTLECVLDSELVVRQLTGVYRIKDERLQDLAARVKQLQASFSRVTYMSVPRHKNKEADRLVNEALDRPQRTSA